MAYPVNINSVAHGSDYWPSINLWAYTGDTRYYFGPDTFNGVAGISTDHTLRAWKSTDKGLTWVEKDSLNHKLIKYEPAANDLFRHGISSTYNQFTNKFYIAYLQQDADATVGTLRVVVFDPVLDIWSTISSATNAPQVVKTDTWSNMDQVGSAFSLTYRQSDGAYIVHFQGAQETVNTSSFGPPTTAYNRTYYQIYVSGAWLVSAVMLAGQSGVFGDFYLSGAIAGTGSRTHFFFSGRPDPLQVVFNQHYYIYQVHLSSADVQDASKQVVVNNSYYVTDYHRRSGPPIFVEGEILFPYLNSDGLLGVARALSAAIPSWTLEAATTSSMPSLTTDLTANSMTLVSPPCDSNIYAFWQIGDGSAYFVANGSNGWTTTYTEQTLGTDIAFFATAHVSDYNVGIYYPQDSQTYQYPVYYREFQGTGDSLQGSVGCCEGTTGDFYFKRIVGDQGNPPYSYELCQNAVLPDGLTLDPITGIISGTPTTAGTTTTCILVRDVNGNTGVTHITTVITERTQPDSPGNTLDLNAYQLKFFRGDKYHFTAQVVDNDGPVDITGGTITLTGKYKYADTDASAAFQLATNLAGIIILDGPNGIFSVNFPEAKTFGFPPYDTQVFYDIQFEDSTGQIFTVTNNVATVLVEMTRNVT